MARGGLICTPSSVTLRSLRPSPTRYTPPGISVPDLPRALATGAQSLSAPRTELHRPIVTVTLANRKMTHLMVSTPKVSGILSLEHRKHDQSRSGRQRNDHRLRKLFDFPEEQ